METPGFHKRKSPRLRDFDYATPYAIFFLTLCSFEKRVIFANADFNQEVIKCIKEEKTRLGHAVYVYCLMPNHLHLLCSPLESKIGVDQLVGGLSSRITHKSWNHQFSGKLFQRSFYDHVVRKTQDLQKIAEYILNNPVRKGLVNRWQDYTYCGILDPLPL